MSNAIIYSWFALLMLILVAGILYPLWNRNLEHYSSCVECCSDLEKEDYQTCRAICRTSGGACQCCDLAVQNNNTMGLLRFFRPTSRKREIIVNNKLVINGGNKIGADK